MYIYIYIYILYMYIKPNDTINIQANAKPYRLPFFRINLARKHR